MKKYLVLALFISLVSGHSFANDNIQIDGLAQESYASQFSVSLQEAKKRLIIMAQADEIVTVLNNEFGDTIASIFFDNGQDFKLIVRTSKKGNIQKQIQSFVDEISRQYDLKIEVIANHPRNFKSVQNIIANQRDRISRQYSSFQMIGYNPKNDAIYLAFYEPNVNERNKISQQFQKLSGMDTIIEFLDNPMTQTSVVGGGALEYSSTLSNGCTAGFTGTMNGQTGFITATHCLTTNTPINYVDSVGRKYRLGQPISDKSIYHEVSFVPVYNTRVLNEVYRYLDGKGANQIYRSNLKITGVGVINTNNAYSTNNIGELQLCHIGQTTGFSCGVVTQVNTGGGGCNATLPGINHQACALTFIVVSGSNLIVKKGDSGGPFFDASGKAYGLASAGEGNFHAMTPITYIIQNGFKLKVDN